MWLRVIVSTRTHVHTVIKKNCVVSITPTVQNRVYISSGKVYRTHYTFILLQLHMSTKVDESHTVFRSHAMCCLTDFASIWHALQSFLYLQEILFKIHPI